MRNVWATGTTSPASATNPALTDAELERIIPLSASNPPQAGLPTLLIHGSGDTLVPVSESETVYRALQAAGAGSTARLIMPPDEEHAFELEQPLVGSKHSSLFEEVCAWLKLALST
jgi:dipeptidyl aminopeptidase/acylaminoacyl peptidase